MSVNAEEIDEMRGKNKISNQPDTDFEAEVATEHLKTATENPETVTENPETATENPEAATKNPAATTQNSEATTENSKTAPENKEAAENVPQLAEVVEKNSENVTNDSTMHFWQNDLPNKSLINVLHRNLGAGVNRVLSINDQRDSNIPAAESTSTGSTTRLIQAETRDPASRRGKSCCNIF